ncbi:ABC transporter ATP-binding protein [Pararhodobacter aggregans]|uniref:ABC transporter ATP-binding protein n=2 Tax=Pararhodobacter TaxID=1097465 RepID=A0A2T7UVG2_9RHOB|nr:ABC transporter ATP-binding protein [Pararhodobacter aggregans]PTX03957.1 amino acid/amide ABC transporter ATP-binding protein 2 (HAAT family) [Pararhodobacter aggregans]PVE48568.1 ABC transporter ATP-binding protein [Pararhodobacter aggregans]
MAFVVTDLAVTKGGRAAVSGVSLRIEPGQVVAVLGANGAGKSELVLGLAGMLPVTAGSVAVDDQPLTGRGPDAIRRAGIAAVPEGHRVLARLSVDDNLRAAGSILPRGLDETLADTYALFPELAERKKQLAGTMSGGQQQMLALGHALMARPRYMLIDEMSLGLAPLVVRRLMGFVEGLKARGVGILLIEQFTSLALGVADTALVLRSGKLRFAGPAQTLRDDPQALDRAYFGH